MGLFTEAGRVITGAKTVEHPLLTRLGVQPARMTAARVAHQLRRPRVVSAEARILARDGRVRIDDFLPAPAFAALREECRALLASKTATHVHDHGRNQLLQYDLKALATSAYPSIAAFLDNPRLGALVEGAERREYGRRGLRVLEELIQKDGPEQDREADLHVDTFFHNHKAWLYLEPVTRDNGPLCYVPRSHRFTMRSAYGFYKESVGENQGSRRVSPQELSATGLREEVLTCAENTLVVANTAGFHRRLPGIPGKRRLAIQFSYRSNPFFPNWAKADKWLTTKNPVIRFWKQRS